MLGLKLEICPAKFIRQYFGLWRQATAHRLCRCYKNEKNWDALTKAFKDGLVKKNFRTPNLSNNAMRETMFIALA